MVFIDPCYEQRESTYAIIIFGLFVYTRVICYCLFFLFCYIFSELRTVGCSASLRLGSVIFWSLLAMPILTLLAIMMKILFLGLKGLMASNTWPLDPVWVHYGPLG